jgi:hypothetical protein
LGITLGFNANAFAVFEVNNLQQAVGYDNAVAGSESLGRPF